MRGVLMLALLAIAGTASAATRNVSARAYVAAIYRRIPQQSFDYRTIDYGRELTDLMARAARFSEVSGDVGPLDGIPFCDCQDNDANYRVMHISSTTRAHGLTKVSVDLRNGDVQRFTVDVAQDHGRWRVIDVHSHGMPSLLAYLRREVPRSENSLRVEPPR